MSFELEEFLSNTLNLRQTLATVLPPEAVNHIMVLVAKDLAHRKLDRLAEASIEEVKSEE